MAATESSRLIAQYVGGLSHVHTWRSNFPGHHESGIALEELAGMVREVEGRPWEFIALTEHTTNPARPERTDDDTTHLVALKLRNERVQGLKLLHGLEVSILRDGRLDVSDEYLEAFDLVLASRHSLPRRIEKNPARIAEHFSAACGSSKVDVLGHPNRFILEVGRVDWKGIFEEAARTNTAVEVNLNIFPRWPRFGGARMMTRSMRHWRPWLEALAASGAPVFIGTDIHQYHQFNLLEREWIRARSGAPSSPKDRLPRLVATLSELGIGPERVISRSYDALTTWLKPPKSKRKLSP